MYLNQKREKVIKNPLHPGAILASSDYLVDKTLADLSKITKIPYITLCGIKQKVRAITPEIAKQLQRYSKAPTVECWLEMQRKWDLVNEREKRGKRK